MSQAVLGAAAAQAVAPRVTPVVSGWNRTAWAGVLGGLSGMAPDLDVLIRSSSDPLLFLEYHRQFSHALVFIPVGALICAALLFPLVRSRLSFGRAYAFCLVGYATHGLLDACTSYGTQLLWPFSDARVAWSNVSVVDPFFTLPLLVLVLVSAFRRSEALARIACVFSIAYLLVGVAQRERAESFGREVAIRRGHEVERVEAKPAFGSLLLWKTIYETGGRFYVDAVRLGAQTHFFPGQSASKLEIARDLPWIEAVSQQARDLERFRWFSNGSIALDPGRANHVIDIRYSMLPNRIDPLWGIRLDPHAAKEAHAAFYTSREPRREQRAELLRMLFEWRE